MEETILRLFAQGLPPSKIDQTLNLPRYTARGVISDTWLADKQIKVAPPKPKRTQRVRFSDELVRTIRATKGKLFAKDVAKQYGISESSVRRIWSGETYGHVR